MSELAYFWAIPHRRKKKTERKRERERKHICLLTTNSHRNVWNVEQRGLTGSDLYCRGFQHLQACSRAMCVRDVCRSLLSRWWRRYRWPGCRQGASVSQFRIDLVSQTAEKDLKACLFSTKREKASELARGSGVAEAHARLCETGGALVRMPSLLFRVPVISGRMGKL